MNFKMQSDTLEERYAIKKRKRGKREKYMENKKKWGIWMREIKWKLKQR